MVDVPLERRRGSYQAEGRNKPFKETKSGPEGCLPLIPFLDSDFVKGGVDVQFRELFGFSYNSESFSDEWKGVTIPAGNSV